MGGIPKDEIWVKFGGDHGRESFKLSIQVANTKKPNSKNFTVLIGLAKVKDSVDNLKIFFEEFKEDIIDMSNAVWKGKQIKVFCLETIIF